MPTINELFQRGFNHCLTLDREWEITENPGSTMYPIPLRVCIDVDTHARFVAFFVPPVNDFVTAFRSLINLVPTALVQTDAAVGVHMTNVHQVDVGTYKSEFCARVFFYFDGRIMDSSKTELEQIANQLGYFVTIRDQKFAEAQSGEEKPLAFICHDTRDKEAVAAPLARELSRIFCPVWYDEYSLKVGDSLRESIDRGLKISKKCVVILSQSFLANSGWTRKEFNSIVQREIIGGQNVILPIWVGISKEDVFGYSAELTDRFAYIWDGDAAKAAQRLRSALV